MGGCATGAPRSRSADRWPRCDCVLFLRRVHQTLQMQGFGVYILGARWPKAGVPMRKDAVVLSGVLSCLLGLSGCGGKTGTSPAAAPQTVQVQIASVSPTSV